MATAVQGAAATGGAGSLALGASYVITSSTSGGASAEASSDEPEEPDAALIAMASEPTEDLETFSSRDTFDNGYGNSFITAITKKNRSYLVKKQQSKNNNPKTTIDEGEHTITSIWDTPMNLKILSFKE